MLDIWQQFEDWEKNDLSVVQEQPVRYMTMDPERIWPGPDSSNDPQSSMDEDEWSSNNGVELPAQTFHAIDSQDRLVNFPFLIHSKGG
jgi:hypothetical protein